MSIVKAGLVARAEALRCEPAGEAKSYAPYRLVVVKKDVVTTGGQAFVEGHLAIAAPDRLELRGEQHALVFSSTRAVHVAVPERDLSFLEAPKT